MTTEAKFAFFKVAYEEEVAREKQIREAAKTYLTLITAYSAFVIFVRDKVSVASVSFSGKIAFVVAVSALAIGFALCVWASKTASYEVLLDPDEMRREIGKNDPTDDQFRRFRIADYVVACSRNVKVNDHKAQMISGSGYAFIVGIIAHAIFFILEF
jgi:hypothetical protein